MIYPLTTHDLPVTNPGPGDAPAALAKPEPSSEAVTADSNNVWSLVDSGDNWPQLVVMLTAALLYVPDRVAQIDPRHQPRVDDVQRWLARHLPVGASPLCGLEDRARHIAERYTADRSTLLEAYQLKAGRGGLTVTRGSPVGLLRWWLDKGVVEAVDGARHATALRRRRSVSSANCNAAWEGRGSVEPMQFDPAWEVRP